MKMVDDHLSLEGLFTVVLYTKVERGADNKVKYQFVTNNDGEFPAKCFGKGTKIRMFDNTLKNIEDVVIGDLVLNTENGASRVEHLHSGTDDLFLVSQEKGIDYIVNSEHLLYVEAALNSKLKYNIATIPTKHYNSFYKLKGIRGRNLAFIDNDVREPYFLGLWLGDGSKSNTSITTADKEIREFLESLAIKYGLNYSEYYKKDNLASECNISSDAGCSREVYQFDLAGNLIEKFISIKEASIKTGVLESSIGHCSTGRYKHAGGYFWKKGEIIFHNELNNILKENTVLENKHIPDNYLNSSLRSRYELLAGLLDSDGSLSNNTFEFSNKSLSLIEQVQVLCDSLGLYTSINSSIVNETAYYKLRIQGEITKIPTKIKRKKATKNSRNSNFLKITPLGRGDYYGFELYGQTKTFFLEDYTIVHNSPFGMFKDLYIPNDLGKVSAQIDKYNLGE